MKRQSKRVGRSKGGYTNYSEYHWTLDVLGGDNIAAITLIYFLSVRIEIDLLSLALLIFLFRQLLALRTTAERRTGAGVRTVVLQSFSRLL